MQAPPLNNGLCLQNIEALNVVFFSSVCLVFPRATLNLADLTIAVVKCNIAAVTLKLHVSASF